MPTIEEKFHHWLKQFAASIREKFVDPVKGAPEEQLRSPFETLLMDIGRLLSLKIVLKGESQLPDRSGKPDFAVSINNLLCGYVELKEPGKGANPNRYKGHDREQWQRFRSLPNVLYCDGNEWSLYRNGEREGNPVKFDGDVTCDGEQAVTLQNTNQIKSLITNFFSWSPLVPRRANELAELIAPLCRLLRQEVYEALQNPYSSLRQLEKDWRELLFPHANDDQFADAYAQTVTFGLLLARAEGGSVADIHLAMQTVAAEHTLLSRALGVLTDENIEKEISTSLRTLQRVIDEVSECALSESDKEDPWLYFYEDFLASYDPALRKNAGAYYTPVEVVHAQVRLVDSLLSEKLKKAMGFADKGVVTLDPAAGTGTYLLGIIEHVTKTVEQEEGKGAVAGRLTDLAKSLFGFEMMTGPYSVAELRVTRALMEKNATLPAEGPGIYLTDTLESPFTIPSQLGLWYEPIAREHKRALKIKDNIPVIVCMGNPPYDRHPAADPKDPENRSRTGGWVRWGNNGDTNSAILNDFLQPALDAGYGGDVKNLYNLYIYFWRWALWKVFEHKTASGPGIVSFISASSYLDGNAFVGVREYMRRLCDEIWILDLGGEGRGTRKSENIFAIQTPVAIAITVCYKQSNPKKPAKVHYCLVEGTKEQKLKTLDRIQSFQSVEWATCPSDWQAPFRPAGKGDYFDWPLLTDVMPWHHSGVQLKRTWPVAPDQETLERRWHSLLHSENRALAFRETEARLIRNSYSSSPTENIPATPISDLKINTKIPACVRYAYRSFDRQWLIADNRMADRIRPSLWRCQSDKQIYLISIFSQPVSHGPCLTVCADIPDLDYFRGSYGAKAVMPFCRDAKGKYKNVNPGLLKLSKTKCKPEDMVSYLYGLLSNPAFTERFETELTSRQLRIPITKDIKLFDEIAKIGEYLIWLHTYGERFYGKGKSQSRIPPGKARCVKNVSDSPDHYPESFEYEEEAHRLVVSSGEFQPVAPAVYHFEVSGLKVVQSWLGYRMKEGKGRKSSPLDDIRPECWTAQFTRELLELIWVLEKTIEIQPKQTELLDKVLKSDLIRENELPPVSDELRNPFQEADTPLFSFL
ncbi:MAG: DNA methyltransferase [Candidatus Omnitrophota bacterium]|jgi:hypothetical protein|nr:MAG: DNA methyltransferase [Candidatus Omnitrophota bacterium]